MGCCGQGRAAMAPIQGSDGQQAVAARRSTRYVVRWVSATDVSVFKIFDSEDEAYQWVKDGNAGTIIHEPASVQL